MVGSGGRPKAKRLSAACRRTALSGSESSLVSSAESAAAPSFPATSAVASRTATSGSANAFTTSSWFLGWWGKASTAQRRKKGSGDASSCSTASLTPCRARAKRASPPAQPPSSTRDRNASRQQPVAPARRTAATRRCGCSRSSRAMSWSSSRRALPVTTWEAPSPSSARAFMAATRTPSSESASSATTEDAKPERRCRRTASQAKSRTCGSGSRRSSGSDVSSSPPPLRESDHNAAQRSSACPALV
ncbi:hypothetical protein HRbin09_01885 [bacterium HR09]|nr:hypothetical protein HRbin09_01885 [bacterium HR09]